MTSVVDLKDSITNHLESGETGALFVVLSNGKLVQIFFMDGHIISAKYQGTAGKPALDALRDYEPRKCKFHFGLTTHSENVTPLTDEVLDLFRQDTRETAEEMDMVKQELVYNALVTCIGPFANVLFDDEIRKASSIDELINNLSMSLDDPEDRDKFTTTLNSLLDKAANP
ncbi:hypothetical protein [Sedimenticola sp.]|uniref:hypothetical protein n=1 Tax=Sedimenticola sp. TaxID=1940285 RepID=UPI003D0EBE7D